MYFKGLVGHHFVVILLVHRLPFITYRVKGILFRFHGDREYCKIEQKLTFCNTYFLQRRLSSWSCFSSFCCEEKRSQDWFHSKDTLFLTWTRKFKWGLSNTNLIIWRQWLHHWLYLEGWVVFCRISHQLRCLKILTDSSYLSFVSLRCTLL